MKQMGDKIGLYRLTAAYRHKEDMGGESQNGHAPQKVIQYFLS